MPRWWAEPRHSSPDRTLRNFRWCGPIPHTCTYRALCITPGYKGVAASIKKKRFLPIPVGIHSTKPSEQERSSAPLPAGEHNRLTWDLRTTVPRTWSSTSKGSQSGSIHMEDDHSLNNCRRSVSAPTTASKMKLNHNKFISWHNFVGK